MLRLPIFLAYLCAACINAPSLIADEETSNINAQIDRVKNLIESLASKNVEPEEPIHGTTPPQGYSRQAQATVFLARKQLAHEGSAACNEFVKHLDDRRYSYTYDSTSGLFNRDVGRTCYELFFLIVCCYEKEIGLLTSDQISIARDIKKDPVAWWKVNRQRPLWELQVEQIDEAIKFFENVDYEKAAPSLPFLKKRPLAEFDKIRLSNIETLKTLRQTIAVQKKPHITTRIDTPLGPMAWLPWAVKSTNSK